MGSLLYFIRKNRGKTFIKQAIKEIIPDCFYSGQDCRSLPDCSRREGRKCVSAFCKFILYYYKCGSPRCFPPLSLRRKRPKDGCQGRAVPPAHACRPSAARVLSIVRTRAVESVSRVRRILFHACGGSCFTRAAGAAAHAFTMYAKRWHPIGSCEGCARGFLSHPSL